MGKIRAYYASSNELVIDSSGKNGNSGNCATHYGACGSNGKDGENAQPVILSLSRNNQKVDINISGVGSYDIPLVYNSKITIVANGGNGGNGGEGGKGRNGEDGTHGYLTGGGMSGRNGGDGGYGGQGGHGGNGGCGGLITIKVNEKDKHLVDNLIEVIANGGRPGLGGAGGRGGQGGNGGQGAPGYSWQQTYSTPSGNVTTYHYAPGGLSGSQGYHGYPGQSGRDGMMGNKGKLLIEIDKITLESLPTKIAEVPPKESKPVHEDTSRTSEPPEKPAPTFEPQFYQEAWTPLSEITSEPIYKVEVINSVMGDTVYSTDWPPPATHVRNPKEQSSDQGFILKKLKCQISLMDNDGHEEPLKTTNEKSDDRQTTYTSTATAPKLFSKKSKGRISIIDGNEYDVEILDAVILSNKPTEKSAAERYRDEFCIIS